MADKFPFALEDITGWVMKRKDGTIVKFSLTDAESRPAKRSTPSVGTFWGGHHSYSDWCSHEPHPDKQPPVFSNGKIGLWIADNPGAKHVWEDFDVCIDGGNVLTVPGENDLPNIYGDASLRNALLKHVIVPGGSKKEVITTKIIKLRWFDRCPPPVYASFWPALLEELRKLQGKKKGLLKVLTICQGGHGRSGSALAALMMCMTDYSPLEALTHIRALHCARAIESKDQHLYLNILAKHLGREENALEAEKVASFREAFLASTSKWAEPYKERLQSGNAPKEVNRGGAFI